MKALVAYRRNRGITLLASLMLIVFISISVIGVSIFVIQSLSHNSIKQFYIKTVNLAEAGLHHAIYFFRFRDLTANGYFSLGQTNIDSNNYFVLSASAADLLMVNTSTAALGGTNNRDLLNLRIQNATDSQAITIDRMVVSWVKTGPVRRLQRIQINGGAAEFTGGNLLTPANANITNFTLPAIPNTSPTIFLINEIRFSGSMAGTTSVTIQFVMTDGSTKAVQVFPAVNNYNFTINSQGQVISSTMRRQIRAEYNALTGRIVDYRE